MTKIEMPLTIEQIAMIVVSLESTIDDIQAYITLSNDTDSFEELHIAKSALTSIQGLVNGGWGETPESEA